jgi:hypothetical protein
LAFALTLVLWRTGPRVPAFLSRASTADLIRWLAVPVNHRSLGNLSGNLVISECDALD